jgi:glycosyltransferase involved in cell wall biosynthesis
MPRFSIVVPCYRAASERVLLEQCVASVARQTFTDFELLLVDDGSPDSSVAVLTQVAQSHPALRRRFHVIGLPTNSGVCAARNAGIEVAQGEYVAFLDFDDLWQPDYLARMNTAARVRPGTQVLLARTDFLRTLGSRVRVHSTGSLSHLNALDCASFNAWHLLNNFPVAMGSAVVVARRLYLEQPDLKFDLALSRTTAEDVLFGFQLLARGIRPWYVDEPLCVHRRMLERSSRGSTAFMHVDERRVNDYIAEHATDSLTRQVIAERPEYAPELSACRTRLNLEFDLKREFRQPQHWFGLRRCLRQPRGFKTLMRLHGTQLLAGGPQQVLLQHYFFMQGSNDSAARKRVLKLLARPRSPTLAAA